MVSVLGSLSVGVLPVGGFIFSFFCALLVGLFVFSRGGGGGLGGTGVFLRARADFFWGIYSTPPPLPTHILKRTLSLNSTFSTTFNKKYIAK